LRTKWLEESKIVNGEFKPAFKDWSLLVAGWTLLIEILEEVKKVLLADWNDINFVIGTNPEEMIEIKFDQQTQDIEKGLEIYMNNLISSNSIIRRYGLRRVPYYWGFKDTTHIYYMVAPPWVRLLVVSSKLN